MALKISLFNNQTIQQIYFCDHRVRIQLQVLGQVNDIDRVHEVLPLQYKNNRYIFQSTEPTCIATFFILNKTIAYEEEKQTNYFSGIRSSIVIPLASLV